MMSSASARNRLDVAIAILAPVALMGAVVLLGYTGRDDSHITYFVAEELARGNGVVNYNNERVEQSSTLLHTFMLAAVSFVTSQPPAQVGPFVSFSFLVMGLILVLPRFPAGPGASFGLVAFLAPPSIYWALSGMENALYLLLLILLCRQLSDARPAGGEAALGIAVLLSGAALTLTRPEAPFVLAMAFSIVLICHPGRRMICLASAAAVGAAGAIVGRLVAGLQVFPNTVYAKQSFEGGSQRIGRGARYLADSITSLPPSGLVFGLLLLAMVWSIVFKARRHSPYLVSLAAFSLAIATFSFASGGDWMEASRFLSPAYVLAGLWAMSCVPDRGRAVVAATMLLAYAFGVVQLSRQNTGGIPLFARYDYSAEFYRPAPAEHRNVIHSRDLSFVDRLIEILDLDPRDRIVIASRQAGMVPHYLMRGRKDRIIFVDLIGLSTQHVQPCRSGRHWHAHPFDDLAGLEVCSGLDFDYIFDLDSDRHAEMTKVLRHGCELLHVESPRIQPTRWKAAFQQRQFVARCE